MTVKRQLEAILQGLLAPIRERRAAYASKPGCVLDVLQEGTKKARAITVNTIRVTVRTGVVQAGLKNLVRNRCPRRPPRSLGGGKVCNRRVSPIAPNPGEGLLTEPTPAVRSWSRERVLMPHSCPCPQARRSVVQISPSEASARRSKKGRRLVVLRLLRLWPLLLLTPYRRA